MYLRSDTRSDWPPEAVGDVGVVGAGTTVLGVRDVPDVMASQSAGSRTDAGPDGGLVTVLERIASVIAGS